MVGVLLPPELAAQLPPATGAGKGRRLKILFLCHRFPYPPNEGGKIRAFHMIRHLSQRHSVTVASLAHSPAELQAGQALHQHCERVIAEVVPPAARWARAGRALLQSAPSSAAYFYSTALQQRITTAWRGGSFDALWVHCAFMAQYVLPLSGGYRVLDYCDMDSAKWGEYARHRPFPFSWGYGLESRKLRRFEISASRHFQHFTVATSGELEEFNRLGIQGPCTIVPNGVDLDHFKPRARKPAPAPVLAFLGRMDYFPNVDAVTYFVKQILPLIRRSLPEAKFRIIGSNPTRTVRRLANIPGVTVTGFVSDVREHLDDVAAAVVPLRICRGTQNKMLESMAMGIPTVATATAARGVQAVAGSDFLAAETPQDFARAVVELVNQPARAAAMAQAARARLESTHCWSASLNAMDRILEEAVSTAPLS